MGSKQSSRARPPAATGATPADDSGTTTDPVCLDCVPTTETPTTSFEACDELYVAWDKCLKAHRGNIADCIAPMNLFKVREESAAALC